MTTRESFEALYRLHYKKTYGFAFKLMGTREDALELTQEAFLALYAQQEKEASIEHHDRWLLGVVRFKAHERWRKKDKQPLLGKEDDIFQHHKEWAAPAEEPERAFTRKEVRRWLEQHKEDENTQMLLMFMEGFGSKELAALFGLSEPSVRKRLQRTREATLRYFRDNASKRSASRKSQ